MTSDSDLLRRFSATHDQTAFAELVRRHVNLVYAAARRQLNGDAHAAEDVTQQVFIDLARKAHPLVARVEIASWLFQSTRYAASNVRRTEMRRRKYESEAAIMPNDRESAEWQRARPLLDDALAELGETDRAAIIHRFLRGLEFAGVGAILGVTEDAARVRVNRALDKLERILSRRGIASSGAALAACLAGEAAEIAPPSVATAIVHRVCNAGTTAAGAKSTLLAHLATKKSFVIASSVAAIGLVIVGSYEFARRSGARSAERSTASLTSAPRPVPAQPVQTASSVPGVPLPATHMRTTSRAQLVSSPPTLPPDALSTPSRAWQTVNSFAQRQRFNQPVDIRLIPSLVCFTPSARQKIEAYLAGMPAAIRQNYIAPEEIVGPAFGFWLWKNDPPKSYSHARDVIHSTDDVQTYWHIERYSGKKSVEGYAFKRFADRWRFGPLSDRDAEELLALLNPNTGRLAVVPEPIRPQTLEDLPSEIRARIARAHAQPMHPQSSLSSELVVNRDPAVGFVRLEHFANVGQATPGAALQTLIWAVNSGDDTALSSALALSTIGRDKLLQYWDPLPAETKARFRSPDHIVAMLLALDILKADAVRIVRCELKNDDHATVVLEELREQTIQPSKPIPMQRTSHGWAMTIPDRAIDGIPEAVEQTSLYIPSKT